MGITPIRESSDSSLSQGQIAQRLTCSQKYLSDHSLGPAFAEHHIDGVTVMDYSANLERKDSLLFKLNIMYVESFLRLVWKSSVSSYL